MNLIFLKLGGSLITDKSNAHTARPDVLRRLAAEILTALDAQPDLRLVIGHGSGSFGHIPAHRYHTRVGVRTASEWAGFIEVSVFIGVLLVGLVYLWRVGALDWAPASRRRPKKAGEEPTPLS